MTTRRPQVRKTTGVIPLRAVSEDIAPVDPEVSYWQTEHLEEDAFRVIRAAVCDPGKRPVWYRDNSCWGEVDPEDEDYQEDPVGDEMASLFAYRVGTPGVEIIDDLVELDMTSELGDDLIYEFNMHPDVCEQMTGKRQLKDVIGK